MGLLDLPLLDFRFPRQPRGADTPELLMTLDLTGDIRLEYQNGLKMSEEAGLEFVAFCGKQNRKHLVEFFPTLIADARGIVPLPLRWKNYRKALETGFSPFHPDLREKGVWECLEALKKGPDRMFNFLSTPKTPQDICMLDVVSVQKNPPGMLISTRLDWKCDFSQVVTPIVTGFPLVMECHVKAVETALAIKLMVRDFLIDLVKGMLVLI